MFLVGLSVNTCVYTCVYIYIYACVCVCVCMSTYYIYIYIYTNVKHILVIEVKMT